MNVLCVGFGFVGKAYALLLRELGHNVYVQTANDNTKVEANGYGFKDIEKFVMASTDFTFVFDAAIIAVPTPTNDDTQDLSIIKEVLTTMQNAYNIKNIIIKSTVIPKSLSELEEEFKKPGQGFYMYPEFLEANNPIGGVFNQKCCAFGKTEDWTSEEKNFVSKLFGLSGKNVTFTTLETACILKYIHNLWLSCNISFWNSMARCVSGDIDLDAVLEETHKSEYFGKHPWHIGTAYGGACLPKDIKAFLSSVSKDSVFKKFIKTIDDVNEDVKKNG